MTATYGTRSRQRNGNARPNYAEDKDIEMDVYDYYHDKKDGDGKRSSSRQTAAAANGDAPRGAAASRKAGTDEAKAGASQNGPKSQPANGGTSASQATQASGAVQPSRKRKAAAQQQSAATSTVSTRKAGNATVNPQSRWPDTNMLTFENCHARPADGRMVADDGTVLEPNGE